MSDMKNTLKGVVRDHRLPRDYKFHFAQPSGTQVWWKNMARYFTVRQLTKQNVSIPLWTCFVSIIIIEVKLSNKRSHTFASVGLHSHLDGLPNLCQLLHERPLAPGFPAHALALPLRQLWCSGRAQRQPGQLLRQEALLLDVRSHLWSRAWSQAPVGGSQGAGG